MGSSGTFDTLKGLHPIVLVLLASVWHSWNKHHACLRDRWIFGKVTRHGHFHLKKLYWSFWTLKQAFLSMNFTKNCNMISENEGEGVKVHLELFRKFIWYVVAAGPLNYVTYMPENDIGWSERMTPRWTHPSIPMYLIWNIWVETYDDADHHQNWMPLPKNAGLLCASGRESLLIICAPSTVSAT